MTAVPRLRFAPSPTGMFHVGSGRSALWNWLIARQTGGRFVLRIEDTDAERNKEEWVEGIRSAMRWLGLDWDEEYRQSERTALYADAMSRLLAQSKAYYCDCDRGAVVARNAAAFGDKDAEHRGYDGHCRSRGLAAGPGRALRFCTPTEGSTVVHDIIRGEPTFEHADLEDFVVARGDGSATFILANVVDDIDMAITHVVRGEEHLSNTPKGILLWQALAPDVDQPVWAHVPVLVNESRQKLSKRRDRVALEDFRDQGFLPEAMRNYLVLLGWSPGGDRERLTVEEMVAEFRLENVSPSPAFFDIAKLTAFNGDYIRELPTDDLAARLRPFLPEADPALVDAIVPLVRERLKVLADVGPLVDFLFTDAAPDDPDSWAKAMEKGPAAREMLDGLLAMGSDLPWAADDLKGLVERIGAAHGLKLGKAQAPVRVAVTGRVVGPPLFEAMEILGRDRTIERLRAARARLG